VLSLILLLAAFCDFYELQRNGYANLYYAAAIRSMLENWHNFFFVSFDPGGFVSVDKPPLGFWIQAASAKLLGFSGFSILLPEALAGVASVGVLYLLIRRIFGAPAGLLAALLLTITPISVVTNRNNTIDSLLVLTVLLGAYAVSRAAEQGSLRWLLLCALLVGLGFNIKMLEAYLVVPAFAAVYLFGAPLRWRTRLWHLALAGVVLLVISLSWVVAVDLTPASARPYVGSSTTNSELELALGYNGLQRLTGALFGARAGAASGAPAGASLGGPGGVSENGAPGLFRLLNQQLGGQVSWLLALAFVGILASGWGMRPRQWASTLIARMRGEQRAGTAQAVAHLTPQQSALVLWGGWLLTQAIFFSVAGFFHTYYLSMLAPSVAALAGTGVVLLWRDYRTVNWRGWLLPAALVLTAITQAIILAGYAEWNSWMTPLIVVVSLIAAGALVWYRIELVASGRDTPQRSDGAAQWHGVLQPLLSRIMRWAGVPMFAAALGMLVLLVGPVTWSGVSLASGAGGTLPTAGPTAASAQVGVRIAGGFPGGARPGAFGGFGDFGPPPSGAFRSPPSDFAGGGPAAGPTGNGQDISVDTQLVAYLEAHRGSTSYLFATLSSQTAAPYIIVTGQPVLTLGGFTGSDQILSLSALQAMIREGQIRYFLLSGGGFGGGGGQGGAGNATLVQWVEANCATIPASEFGSSGAGAQVYACGGATSGN
jgi:4-amino-4-deoxy-L-arabinose transferase-like glycosyltransferase